MMPGQMFPEMTPQRAAAIAMNAVQVRLEETRDRYWARVLSAALSLGGLGVTWIILGELWVVLVVFGTLGSRAASNLYMAHQTSRQIKSGLTLIRVEHNGQDVTPCQ